MYNISYEQLMTILILDPVVLPWLPVLGSPQDDVNPTCSVTALEKYYMN